MTLQEQPQGEPPPEPSAHEGAPGEAHTTRGGYQYTIVDDSAAETRGTGRVSRGARRGGVPIALAAAAVVLAAAAAALATWFVAGEGSPDDGRVHQGVSNLLNAFGQDQQFTSTRYEGQEPPGFPDLPRYGGADVVASVLQVQDGDASYLVVYDTEDDRDDVTAFYRDAFDEDPWQVEQGQDSASSTLFQFSNIEDADIEGIVLVTDSKDADLTTIIVSVQEVAGAPDEAEDFAPGEARSAPEGLPELPVVRDAVLVQSAFQRQAGGRLFALSYLSQDDTDVILDFYRADLEDRGYTVEDLPAENAPPGGAGIGFRHEADGVTGTVSVSDFPVDDAYRQIEVQVSVGADGGS
jgi:hypothetical protein